MVPPPPENIMPTPKDQETTHPRKTTTTTTTTTTTRPAPEQGIKCPRCDSSNTKFCYYNNYSLTQPRHFCKTCRRYWTNGGALRNVPIGGGCRKNKRIKSSSSSTSSTSFSRIPTEFNLRGLNIPPEYNLGALPFPSRLSTNTNIPTPNTTTAFFNHFSSFGDVNVNSISATNGFQLDHHAPPSNSLVGLTPPWALGPTQPSLNVHSTLASSIESLSNVNQDLHMKLQQQRLGTMMFGGDDIDNNGDGGSAVSINGFQNHQHKPVMFQNLQISRPESLSAGASVTECPSGPAVTTLPPPPPPTEWFFRNSSSFPSLNATTSNGDEDDGANGNGNDNNNWSAGLTWGDLQHQQYSSLP